MRLRFAPSPTGYLHIGNARTALFNYLYARSNGGAFILRIEDTDQERSTPEATRAVLDSMRWMGLEWDEGPEKPGDCGPYFQSQRNDIYNSYLEKLIGAGAVYPCFCSEEELRQKKEAAGDQGFIYDGSCRELSGSEIEEKKKKGLTFVHRLKVPDEEVAFLDMVRGEVKVHTSLFGDFVLFRSDGSPTYNFAVVIDDTLMKISHVLRGDDHISNTPKQLLVYKALGIKPPEFGHISMILGPNKQKLSKRHGATSILEFRQMGYLPEAFNNQLALLGWTPPDGEEIIGWEELKTAFKEPRFHHSPAVFDYARLDFLNAHYIKGLPAGELSGLVKPFLEEGGHHALAGDEKQLSAVLQLLQERLTRLSDITTEITPFITESFDFSPEEEEKLKEAGSLFALASEYFSGKEAPHLAEGEFAALAREAGEKLGIKGKGFYHPVRLALTGSEQGLDLAKFLQILPREVLLRRLTRFCPKI